MSERIRPQILVGFEGVIADPHSKSKRPQPVPGVDQFLRGAQEAGADVVGVISARRKMQKDSIALQLAEWGLDKIFPQAVARPDTIILANGYYKMAERVARFTGPSVTGILVDRFDKFGIEMVKALRVEADRYSMQYPAIMKNQPPAGLQPDIKKAHPQIHPRMTELDRLPEKKVIIGVTATESAGGDIEALYSRASKLDSDMQPLLPTRDDGVAIWAPAHKFTMEAFMLPPFSAEAGEEFAQRLYIAQPQPH